MKKFNEIADLFIEDVNNDQGKIMTIIDECLKYIFHAFLFIGLPVMGYCLLQFI